ncbi:MAG: PepSY domain-containing protein [Gemmatimonadales bacterium]|nr:PepSY domain-containing protein [Gemmatimonadales bacterium]
MRANVLIRKLHYWASIIIALPASILLGSGLLLQMKKHWSWVQPVEQRGTGTMPQIDLPQILRSVSGVPELAVDGWDDINRLDVRPGRGVVKVSLHSGWEAQIDLGTGAVMQTAYRRSDLIESIHDGSFFAGNWTKLGLFLPTGIILLFLWGSGLWLFWVPIAAKRRRATP